MLIDVHAHAYTEAELSTIAGRTHALDGKLDDGDPNKWSLKHPGTLEALLEAERSAGVDRFVLLPITRSPSRLRAVNNWVIEASRVYPEVIPFGTVLVDSGNVAEELEYLYKMGVKGIKIHPFLQETDILKASSMKAWKLMEEMGLILLLDTMSMEGLVKYKPHLAWVARPKMAYSLNADRIARLAKAFPSLTIIAAHMGCLYGWDGLEPLFELGNVYFDTSFVVPILEDGIIMGIMEQKGYDHIVFGTDAPWRHPLETVRWLRELPIGDREKAMIAGENFLWVLKREQEEIIWA